jgi:ABC-type Fe3+-hydroxamate transport system substrate-binding protein
LIRSLEPDLIIANKEENERNQVLALQDECPVWTSDIPTLDAALEMIEQLGMITNRITEASRIKDEIRCAFADLSPLSPPVNVAYLIWQEPYMTIGGDTFNHDMMARAGLINIFGDLTRYPAITLNELRRRGCRLLLLSSEPFPFGEKHADGIRKLLPGMQVELVDGEMFSWYGSRLIKLPGYLNNLFTKIKMNKTIL